MAKLPTIVSALAVPFCSFAQQQGKVWRIG